jgi:predicted HicB family RNase H-like nuclease
LIAAMSKPIKTKKGRTTVVMNVSITPDLKAAIEAAAKADDRSVSSWCVHHLKEHLPEPPAGKAEKFGDRDVT